MPCPMKNPSNVDLSSLGPHVQGMYDYFDQKLGFQKPPTMHFDSDPSNQASVLGKTAYYDPSSLEIHVFTDGRHPKDMLRSIAHELIHHQQNLEGRLDVGGYMGEGYYLKNEAMRELEQEAMLQGNSLLREYEDTIKSEERNKMSLKEWKNNELNGLLLKKFGILKEAKGEKGDANPLGGEREKFDKDLDGVPDGGDKDPNDPEIKEQVTRDEVRADFKRMFPKETPEQIEARVDDYMEPPISKPKRRGDPNAPMPLADIPGNVFRGLEEKAKLQEALKKLAKAKNITLKSSGKKIK